MNPWVNIVLALIPEARAVVAALVALRKKYPQLSAEEIAQIVKDITTQADSAFDAVLARIAADQESK